MTVYEVAELTGPAIEHARANGAAIRLPTVKLHMSKKGQARTPETRARIAAALRGNRNGIANAGMIRTPEARQRMSAARQAGYEARKPGLSYTAVHNRLRRVRGTPSACEHCGTTTAKKFEWAYAGEGHERGTWNTDLSQYIRLCTSCHMAFDGHPRQKQKGGDVDVSYNPVLFLP